MLRPLVTQANEIAQEHGVSVFPAAADKRPLIRNWPTEAAFEPEDVEKQFSMPGAELIGVPMKQNGLIAFDLDYGHTDDPDRKAALAEFEEALLDAYPGGVRVHRTRSGGKHLIMNHPEGKVPGYIMPKLDVRSNAYIVWAGPGYEVEVDVALEDLAKPGGRFIEVWERAEGVSGDHLPTLEEADHILRSNGDDGQRHLALLKLAQEWVRISDPATQPEEIAAGLERHLRAYYSEFVEPGRFEKLVEWRYDRQRQHWDGELGRALGKPIKEMQQLNAFVEIGRPLYEAAQQQAKEEREAAVEAEYVSIDLTGLLSEDLEDIDWLIPDLLPAGNLVSLTGPSGAGKTRFNALLMSAASTGQTDMVGLPKASRPLRSLYVSNEERTSDIQRRLKAAMVANGLKGGFPVMVRGKEHGRFKLVNTDGDLNMDAIDQLAGVIKAHGVELVMIDPVVTLGIEDENAAPQVDAAMAGLHLICTKTGACVLFVHHTPKGDRGQPVDAFRGDSSAWRGSGAFYSSLDVGLTLVPWLPDECHAKGADGAAARRRWRDLRLSGAAPNYVVLDGAKERENERLPSVLYEIVGREVRPGGRKIGAMRPVDFRTAQLTATQLLTAGADLVEVGKHTSWAMALTEDARWSSPGRYDVALKDLVDVLDKARIESWKKASTSTGRVRADRGHGKVLIDAFAAPVPCRGGSVQVLVDDSDMHTKLLLVVS